ncbi:hypothetical protein SiH_0165 [Sulfolobus islandicus HVE10/4]|uniref:Uncharacterized protein n=1 Tax=Saccharolobus islandicus (strain HVE10/4) TaxID=930943 RepID=F0NJ23_SACI0|nr:hypothetical protein SiH_0165 [Sulfolobus islandicus HVE10/4]
MKDQEESSELASINQRILDNILDKSLQKGYDEWP